VTRAIVTGGSGFLGSHLCRRLLSEGWEVVCLDSLLTGDVKNIADLLDNPGFLFEQYDVTRYLAVNGHVDWLLHFASPASPRDYLKFPIHTLKVGALGALRALGVAKAIGAGFLLASTSEVYGDPLVHPQPESYLGNVNSVGPRGVYDEAKRYAEAMAAAYHRVHGIPVRIARIFNTYGPGMRRDDGRAVPTFISQALSGQPLTVHGQGRQTRSLCYVDDLIEGIWRLLLSGSQHPVNLGNPQEISILELAKLICRSAGSQSDITLTARPEDDPEVRCPEISLARSHLHWEPHISLTEGLARTIAWAKEAWEPSPGLAENRSSRS
jgi:dTDP-glucose 4,6-dehydratase